MTEADVFIAELERLVTEARPGVRNFGSRVYEAPRPFTHLGVWFTDESGEEQRSTWELRYLSAVAGSDEPVVLARWAADRILSGLQRVDLNCDWGHEWPLWAPGSDFYNAEPSDLGLSAGLAAELRSFYDFWEAHFIFQKGWDDPSSRDRAHAEALRLRLQLAAETESRFAIESGFRYSFP